MKKLFKPIISLLLCVAFILGTLITASAAEVTSGVAFTYKRKLTWKDFDGNGRLEAPEYIDGIKIQTNKAKSYYLEYRTLNEGQTDYYYADSNINTYAGNANQRIQRLGIRVKNASTKASITTGIVVMYRVKVKDNWLAWVSNADPEWMRFVQRKYGLCGVLDTASGYAGLSDGSFITGVEIRIFEESRIESSDIAAESFKLIEAPFISQLNTYPTGCESVSTVMAFNHFGSTLSVDSFIDDYLEKGSAGSFDPNVCFGGDPRSSNGMGCYAPVIIRAAEKAAKGTGLYVENVSGKTPKELCEQYIDNDIPVIFWATIGMKAAYNGKKISYNGKTIQWIAPEHCLLLIGYTGDSYIFNDPTAGMQYYYDREAVENAYYGMGAQSVVVRPIEVDATVSAAQSYELPQGVYSPDYINTNKGSFEYKNTLLKLQTGKKLEFILNYSSQNSVTAELGTGFYHNYQRYVEPVDGKIKLYINPYSYISFYETEQGVYFAEDVAFQSNIITVTENGYTLSLKTGECEYYDQNGRLIGLKDRYGIITDITYTENTMIISDGSADSITVEYENGRIFRISSQEKGIYINYTGNVITEIFMSDKGTLSVRYDDALRVISVTEDTSTKEITYSADGRMSSIDGTAISHTVDGLTVNENGNEYSYTFNSDGTLNSFSDGISEQSFGYDSQQRLNSKITDNGIEIYSYNEKGFLSAVTLPDGSQNQYYYDTAGNLIKKVYPLKGDADMDGTVTILDFICLNKYMSGEDVNCSEYNSSFNTDANRLVELKKLLLLYKKGALRRAEEFFYNESRQLIRFVDTENNVTEYSYDSFGNLVEE